MMFSAGASSVRRFLQNFAGTYKFRVFRQNLCIISNGTVRSRLNAAPCQCPFWIMIAAISSSTVIDQRPYCEGDVTKKNKTLVQDDSAMIDNYIKTLMDDDDLVILPLGIHSAPILFDLLGLHRSIILETISAFEVTILTWNDPIYQGIIVGHPIVYECHRSKNVMSNKRYLLHNPAYVVPWKTLDAIAKRLVDDPRISPRIFAKAVEEKMIMNILRILSSVLLDLMLSSSATMYNGAFQMSWTFHPEKWEAIFHDGKVERAFFEALDNIDFDIVDDQAKAAVDGQGAISSYVEEEIYSLSYKIMLLLFYFFSEYAECQFMGRVVKQNIRKKARIAEP